MRPLALLLALASPALASFAVSSATVPAGGIALSVVNSSAYVSGSPSACYSVSGAATGQANTIASVAWSSGTTATVTLNAPVYAPDTLTVSLLAGCGVTTSAGAASASSVTATNNSLYYAAGDAHWSGKIRNQGSPANVTDGNGYVHSILFNSANGSQDFAAQLGGSTLSVWSIPYGNAITLWIDGVINSRVALGGGTTYVQTSFTGLDTTASHTYRMEQSGTGSGFQTAGLAAINIPAGTTFGSVPAARPVVTGCGSSAWDMVGGGSATPNADQTHWGLLSAAYGITFQGYSYAGHCLGTGGSCSAPSLASTCPANVVPYTAVSPALEIFQPDSNDLTYSNTLANFQSAAQTAVTNTMGNAAPPARLFVVAPNITANSNGTIGNCATSAAACYASYTTSLAAGVAAAANANTTFVHTVSLPNGGPDWLNSACSPTSGADLQSDCLHPLAATAFANPGYGKFANRYAPIVSGVQNGYSFTATGTNGNGCALVTMAIPGGNATVGYPTFQDTLTLTSSVSGDVLAFLSPATGSGTGSAALGNNAGANSIQAQVCGAAGLRMISFANLPEAWVAPANVSLTISQACCLLIGAITHIP